MIQDKYMKTTSYLGKKPPLEKGRKTYQKKIIICEEPKSNEYELLTEKCRYIHYEFYHGYKQSKETETKFKDEEEHSCPDMKRFRRGGTPSRIYTNKKSKRKSDKISSKKEIRKNKQRKQKEEYIEEGWERETKEEELKGNS